MARPREFDEASVLEIIQNEFWNCGYAATSMGDLTAATGLGKGSLYAAFGDKRALFGRVLDAYCDEAVAAARRALEGPDANALDRLWAYVLSEAAKAGAGKHRRGCMLSKSASELGTVDTAIRKRALSTYNSLRDAIAACIRAAQRSGAISASTDADQAAALVFVSLRGLDVLGRTGAPSTELRSIAESLLESLSPA